MLYHILNVFYKQAHTVTRLYAIRNFLDFILLNTKFRFYGSIGFLNSNNNFSGIKVYCLTIALNNFHNPSASFLVKIKTINSLIRIRAKVHKLFLKYSYTLFKALTVTVKALYSS